MLEIINIKAIYLEMVQCYKNDFQVLIEFFSLWKSWFCSMWQGVKRKEKKRQDRNFICKKVSGFHKHLKNRGTDCV